MGFGQVGVPRRQEIAADRNTTDTMIPASTGACGTLRQPSSPATGSERDGKWEEGGREDDRGRQGHLAAYTDSMAQPILGASQVPHPKMFSAPELLRVRAPPCFPIPIFLSPGLFFLRI